MARTRKTADRQDGAGVFFPQASVVPVFSLAEVRLGVEYEQLDGTPHGKRWFPPSLEDYQNVPNRVYDSVYRRSVFSSARASRFCYSQSQSVKFVHSFEIVICTLFVRFACGMRSFLVGKTTSPML